MDPWIISRRRRRKGSAMHCDHANEMPATCPCPDHCYCKEHTCKSLNSHASEEDAWRAVWKT